MPTLHWIGKDKVVNHHTEVPFRVLEHKYGYRGNNPADTSETHSGNKIIHGDNLEALKALLPEYEGKINCVYIDPPYNTGNEGWIYNDNVNDPHIRKWLGEVVGIEGEDLTRHDKWACMIVPRLRLIERLMSSTASLVISISYHELHTLLCICREMFSNKQVIPVTIQTSGGKPSGGFNYLHEYLVFVVNKDFEPNLLDFCGGTPRRPFEGLTLSTFNKVNRPNQAYPIFIDPVSGSLVGVGKSLQELIDEGAYTGEKEDYIYDYSVAPEGTVAVWPITSKGKECVWRQIPNRVLNDWDKGYIKVIKNKVDGHPNSFSVQYLPEGLIKKINKGLLEVIGCEDGKPTLVLGENETEGSSIPTIWTEKDFYTVKGTNALKEILPESEKKFDYPMEVIAMTKEELVGIDKGLYVAEETVNDFEYDVISAIADNPNVLFWHRNREKKEFCINGFINHYPDFIVRMKSGKTILVETKGDHLVNDDSKNKIWLGNKWADLAGNNYRYFMVFQTKEVEGAITVKQLLLYMNEL